MSALNFVAQQTKLELLSGADDFYDIRLHCDVMVDKSLFIEEFLTSNDRAVLITRSRRTGKTLNLDMLKKFLAIEVDEHGIVVEPNPYYKLFAGGTVNLTSGTKELKPLAIAQKDSGIYMQYQGKLPVIHLNFAEVKGNSFDEVIACFKKVISSLYLKHEYLHTYLLSKGGLKSEITATKFKKLAAGEVDEFDLKESILFLGQLMHEFHHQKVYVLVDEYDKPFNYLLEKSLLTTNKEAAEKISLLTTSLLSHCSKNNDVVEKIFMTGIYDSLQKEGNSGFNNLKVYGVTDSAYSRHFGFSQAEVNQTVALLHFDSYHESLILENLKTWYNGYYAPINSTHNIAFYIPWAVMSYLSKAYIQHEFQPENYWPRTGSRAMLQNLIQLGSESLDLRHKFANMTLSNEVELFYDSTTSLSDILQSDSKNEGLVTYLLLNSGYLTVRREGEQYFFRIPNYEVEKEFIKVIQIEIRSDKHTSDSSYREYLDSLLHSLKADEEAKNISSAILKSDTKAFGELIDLQKNNQLDVCEYKGLNFFHMVGISGNCEIYLQLTELCKKELLSVKDAVHGLHPLDYALVLNNSELVKLMSTETVESSIPSKPGLLTTIYCNNVMSAGISAVMLVGCKDYVKNYLAGSITAFSVAVVVKFIASNSKTIKKYFDSHVCDHYDYYHAIQEGSLMGLIKQSNANNEYYITAQINCSIGDTAIQRLEIFENNEFNLSISLCQSKQDEDNQSFIDMNSIIDFAYKTTFVGLLLLPAVLLGCTHINALEVE